MTLNPQNVYSIALKRDADFWQDELTLTDELGALVTLSSAELIIHPSGVIDPVVWNESNGKLLLPSPGVIGFSLTIEDIAGYQWKTGRYCLALVFSNGKRDGSFLRGSVSIAEAC